MCVFGSPSCKPRVQVDVAQLEAAHELLRPFMLRRLKKEVELGMVRTRWWGGHGKESRGKVAVRLPCSTGDRSVRPITPVPRCHCSPVTTARAAAAAGGDAHQLPTEPDADFLVRGRTIDCAGPACRPVPKPAFPAALASTNQPLAGDREGLTHVRLRMH